MKKVTSLCATALFLSSATFCCAQAPPADAPAVAPAAAPAVAPAAAPAVAAPKPVVPPANKPGMVAPEWEVKTVPDGKTISSKDLKGKAYALIFVNSACADCSMELSSMSGMKFNDKFMPLIAAVDMNMTRAMVIYRDELKVPFTIVDDSKYTLGRMFGLVFSPATVVVDADGKVEYSVAGYTDETKKATLAALKKYLAK